MKAAQHLEILLMSTGCRHVKSCAAYIWYISLSLTVQIHVIVLLPSHPTRSLKDTAYTNVDKIVVIYPLR